MCKFLFVIFKVSITKIIKVGFTHFLKHYPEILFNLIKMLKNWKTKGRGYCSIFSGGAADLYFAAAQQRDDEPGDDGRDNPFFGRDARRDAECDSQRQRDDADDDAGH